MTYVQLLLLPGTPFRELSRRFLFVNGPWHSGKQGALLIWTRFHSQFWAGACFSLMDRSSYRSRRLQFVLNWLAHLMAAYPLFRQQLLDTVDVLRREDGPQLDIAFNLRDCFEFYIPVVSKQFYSTTRQPRKEKHSPSQSPSDAKTNANESHFQIQVNV